MKETDEKSGHRDLDGTWIDETPAAKLRNRLSGFWTLSTMLTDNEMREKIFNDENIKQMIIELAKSCENNKSSIIKLIDELDKTFGNQKI